MVLALAALLATGPVLLAQSRNEPPLAGRPADFSGVVGVDYRISFTAAPTELCVEDPITVTIHITGKDPPGGVDAKYRPQLSLLAPFRREVQRDFYVEPVAERTVEPGSWEFVYRLRPKSTRVKNLPQPCLSYFWPGRGYRKAYPDASEPIMLNVKPRREVKSAELGLTPLGTPERLYQLATSDAVLEHDEPWVFWQAPVLLMLGLGIPVLSWLAVQSWQAMLPGGLRRLHRQRSQAARRAVRDLSRLGDGGASSLADIVTTYLRQRLDFAPLEPTPEEVARFLKRRGVSVHVRRQWAELFRLLDEVRYAAPAAAANECGASACSKAVQLIFALEAEPCLARPR